jgi:hypothetical protein
VVCDGWNLKAAAANKTNAYLPLKQRARSWDAALFCETAASIFIASIFKSGAFHGYADPAQHLSESTENMTIDLVPVTAAEYPPAIFDPAALTTGPNVEGY